MKGSTRVKSMNIIRKTLIIAFLITVGTAQFVHAQNEGMTPQQQHARLEYLYHTAMEYYNSGKYSHAIHYWQAVLNLDPTQTQPKTLIKNARSKIKGMTDPVYKEVKAFYREGNYISAQEKILVLLNMDSTHRDYRKLYDKLQDVMEIFSSLEGSGKISGLLRKSINNYLNKPENIRLSYIFCRYASELDTANQKAKDFSRLLEENYSYITEKEKPIKGMNFVDQSLFVALNHIYDGRYDLAISKCEDVLSIEPNNIMALKRLGSSFYALGNKSRAREYWGKVLKLNPKDTEIRRFLNK